MGFPAARTRARTRASKPYLYDLPVGGILLQPRTPDQDRDVPNPGRRLLNTLGAATSLQAGNSQALGPTRRCRHPGSWSQLGVPGKQVLCVQGLLVGDPLLRARISSLLLSSSTCCGAACVTKLPGHPWHQAARNVLWSNLVTVGHPACPLSSVCQKQVAAPHPLLPSGSFLASALTPGSRRPLLLWAPGRWSRASTGQTGWQTRCPSSGSCCAHGTGDKS